VDKKKKFKTKLTHNDIVKYSRKVLKRSGKFWTCPVTFMELSTANNEIPDVIGFHSGGSALIEAKASRNDFLSDKKKFFRKNSYMGMGNYRFYACPTNMISKEELPEKWGLIYVSDKGRCTIIVKPEKQEANIKAEHSFLYSVIRRIIIYHDLNEIEQFIKKYSDFDEREFNLRSKYLYEKMKQEQEFYKIENAINYQI